MFQPIHRELQRLQKKPDPMLSFKIKHGVLVGFERPGVGFQTRAESTIKMVMDALIGLSGTRNITKNFRVRVADFPETGIEKETFYYCIEDKKDLPFVIPDFVFESWKQAGIQDYSQTIAEIIARGSKPFTNKKMFWIGNVETHPNRAVFMQIAEQHPKLIEAYDTKVANAVSGKNVPYVSLPDHTNYKYLIDIEGIGYSGRIPFLLASQRVVFIQERRWKAFYHFDLVPYKHFIPVKNDLSDLLDQIAFVESQGSGFYNKITDNALAFVQIHLSYEKVIEVLQQKLLAQA